MFSQRISISLFRVFGISRRRFNSNFTSINDDQPKNKRLIEICRTYLDISKQKANFIIEKNPGIFDGNSSFKEIESTLRYLTNKYSSSEILKNPACIIINASTYENRHQVLKECLFRDIQLSMLVKYASIMRKNVSVLKAYNYIIPHGDVIENLKIQLNIPININKSKLSEQMSLNDLRRDVMNVYLRERLQMTDEEINRARDVYRNLKHRSLKSIVEVLDILLNEFDFTREKIVRNAYLLSAHPKNILNILETTPCIADVDIKQILKSRPKIMMQSSENIRTIIDSVKKFNIPESSIIKCHEIFTLSPETVNNRLAELYTIKEFHVMFSHPRILKLIYYYNTARSRMEQLKQLKTQCYSLNLLSATSAVFEKYVCLGEDKTKGKEIFHYLSKQLNMPNKDVRAVVLLHPRWTQVSVLSIKQTIDFLLYNNFTQEDIKENILLLLYPVSRIKPKLEELLEWEMENNYNNAKSLPSNKLLNMCLYFIESEYHFTGDAVFETTRVDSKNDALISAIVTKNLIEGKKNNTFNNVSTQANVTTE
ncbi:hypothetical protein PVAND_011009 [Polypedilum vanderplanki]|uniref:Uncharacterized protein n=1 Tax=Polypedilum vanderplanki TaxID=319348 RepID=A0A9J6CHC4_POLVA|nr:hypothetical protein PVAND_011009 [Polypedilum vanderplanki]